MNGALVQRHKASWRVLRTVHPKFLDSETLRCPRPARLTHTSHYPAQKTDGRLMSGAELLLFDPAPTVGVACLQILIRRGGAPALAQCVVHTTPRGIGDSPLSLPTALHKCAQMETDGAECAALLLAAGEDPNAKASIMENATPLHCACDAWKPVPRYRGDGGCVGGEVFGTGELARVLLAGGALHNVAGTGALTDTSPLCCAVISGDHGSISALLDAGADASFRRDHSSWQWRLPLHIAATHGDHRAVALLLSAGADPATQEGGFTAAHAIPATDRDATRRWPQQGFEPRSDGPRCLEELAAYGAPPPPRRRRWRRRQRLAPRGSARPRRRAARLRPAAVGARGRGAEVPGHGAVQRAAERDP